MRNACKATIIGSGPLVNRLKNGTFRYSLNAFSMGLGYKISDSLNLDANVSYAFSKKLSKDDRDYDYPVVSLRTGVGYSF